MKATQRKYLPLAIGLGVGLTLFCIIGWWGFLLLFPWIGFSISVGIHLQQVLPQKKNNTGRRVSILLVAMALLVFLPLANNENLQLEGVVLLLLAGYFSKGVIHYAVAKVFGPLIWGRGFCGWACWTAAALEWLPIKRQGRIPPQLWNLRYLSLLLSIILPLYLVLVLSYDVRAYYLDKAELSWMLVGNLVYYLAAVPMAFLLQDRRAFCKVLCPVSLIMKVPAKYARIRKKPTVKGCTECGVCNQVCLMDIDVMSSIGRGRPVESTECILCGTCTLACPAGAIS